MTITIISAHSDENSDHENIIFLQWRNLFHFLKLKITDLIMKSITILMDFEVTVNRFVIFKTE